MAASDSVLIGPLTSVWQNLWDLCNAKYIADGIPMFDKICNWWKIQAKEDNPGLVYWSRTSIGNEPAGVLSARESNSSSRKDQSLYNIYVKDDGTGCYIYIERGQ